MIPLPKRDTSINWRMASVNSAMPTTVKWAVPLLALAGLALGALIGLLVNTIANPFYVGVATLGLMAAVATVLRVEWGLLVLVFILYTRFSDVLVHTHGLPSIAQPFIALLLAAITLRLLWRWRPPRGIALPMLLLLSYGVVGLASMLYAADTARVQGALLDYAKDVVIAMIVVLLLQKGLTFRRIIWALLAAGIFMGTLSVYQQLTGTFDNNYWGFSEGVVMNIVGSSSDQRIAGPGLGPNAYAQFLLVLAPLALDRLWHARRPLLRLLAGWAFVVCTLSVIFTFSRGAFLGLIVVLLVMFVRRPPKPVTALVSLVILAFMLQFVPPQYKERMATLTVFLPFNNSDVIEEAQYEVSFRGRLSENLSGWLMFSEHPFVGVGFNNYKNNYQEYARRLGLDPRLEARSAHSLYLQTVAEQGMLGLAWLLIFLGFLFGGLRRAYHDFAAAGQPDLSHMTWALGVGILSLLVTGIFLHTAHPRYFWLLYGIALAVPQAARFERAQAMEKAA